MLYNAPRAASIVSDTDSLLWCLDRETFNHIVKDSSRRKREQYESFLAKVKILESMEPYERSVLSDAFLTENFKAGDTVNVHYKIREGNKERTQVFQGVVLQRRNPGSNETFTVRKISNGIGVERIFPSLSPFIEKVDVVSRGVVRRARLFYLRAAKGKKARIKTRIG